MCILSFLLVVLYIIVQSGERKGIFMKPTIDPIDIHVGNNLFKYRKMRGISQTELSARIGVTFQQLQKYEKGANRLSASRLYKAAVALSIDIGDFYNGFNDNKKNTVISKVDIFDLDNKTIEMLRLFKGIKNQDIKKNLITLLKSVSSE